MKTYSERTADVQKIMKKKRKERLVAVSCLSLAVVLLLVLFVPYRTTPPSVRRYADSEYYDVICRLNEVTFQKPRYANNFEALTDNLLAHHLGGTMSPAPGDLPEMDAVNGAQDYVEVTDNQVQGVTEADIFKRSDQYLYHLHGISLTVYSIAGEDSRELSIHNVCDFLLDEDGISFRGRISDTQMYLSEDCTTVTVTMDYYDNEVGSCVVVANVDVTDPENPKTENYVFLTGNIISSRMVGNQLLLTFNYRIRTDGLDFDKPETFVPSYGVPGAMQVLPSEQIVCPEDANAARYTVVCSLDASTLDVQGTVALMSYSQEIYVSQNAIYATCSYTETLDANTVGWNAITNRTRITGISYTGGTLAILGSVSLNGSVKDQYSMDEYEGILRVVTTTSSRYAREWSDGLGNTGLTVSGISERNVDLYCVDLSDWSVAASVIGFAPEGEEATAIRFDGANAYVCTAQIVTLTDPVYFFDLSDPKNITYTDTGTIPGYSSSLIQLGNGYLLGIGYGDTRMLKIEVYEQGVDTVESVCVWESDALFSEEYKSYLIDRKSGLIGLSIIEEDCWQYVLLQFDGYELQPIARVNLEGLGYVEQMGLTRAAIVEDYLYILAPNNGLLVEKIG